MNPAVHSRVKSVMARQWRNVEAEEAHSQEAVTAHSQVAVTAQSQEVVLADNLVVATAHNQERMLKAPTREAVPQAYMGIQEEDLLRARSLEEEQTANVPLAHSGFDQ